MTDIESGEYNKVVLHLNDLVQTGVYPLINIHTHPMDSLLSPSDFTTILTDYGIGGERVCAAEMILCPHMQILALATPTTPFLSPQETDELIIEPNTNIKSVTQGINGYIRTRIEAMGDRMAKSQLALETAQNQLIEQLSRQTITQQEMLTKLADLYKKEEIRNKRRVKREIKKQREIKDQEAVFANTATLEFIRRINIKLYISTNFRDFEEFSA